MDMVSLLMLMVYADFFLLHMFDASVSKLLLLVQGLVKLFLKMIASSGNSNIDKEWGGIYDTSMVLLFLIMFGDAVQK